MYDPKFVLTALLLMALFTAFVSQALADEPDHPLIIGTVPNPESDERDSMEPGIEDDGLSTLRRGDPVGDTPDAVRKATPGEHPAFISGGGVVNNTG